jgi:hypothetical protein
MAIADSHCSAAEQRMICYVKSVSTVPDSTFEYLKIVTVDYTCLLIAEEIKYCMRKAPIGYYVVATIFIFTYSRRTFSVTDSVDFIGSG